MGSLDLVIVGPVLVILLLSLAIHEAAHGWVALKCGDTTARDLGRITFNPIPHIDPIMTIALPIVLMLTTGMPFGGAKPVPVAFHRLRNPWRDMSLVALAGPASNFLLAIFFMALYRIATEHFGMTPVGRHGAQVLPTVLELAVLLNLLLTAFNLIPIPPLDGSRVMAWILPGSLRDAYVRLETIGMFVIFGLLMMGFLRPILIPVMDGLYASVWEITRLGGLL